MITNIPTKKFSDPKVQILRRGAEYRALFLYHILKALKDHGYEFEMIGREGIFALGRSQIHFWNRLGRHPCRLSGLFFLKKRLSWNLDTVLCVNCGRK